MLVSILASFVAFLDGSVVNVALPTLARELGGGLVLQQWVVDIYLITMGSLMLIAGSLSDVFGRKKILFVGLLGFAISSIACACAPTGSLLVAARAVQGVAGALLVPSSLALIISVFSGKAQGKAIGSWTAWTGIAFVVGPLLGGFLVDNLSWRFIFAINVLPIAVTVWLLLRINLASEQRREQAHVDGIGALLCSIGLGSFVYALIEQNHYGWTSPLIYVPGSIGIVALLTFFVYEKRASHPMLPLELFKIRNFSVGNLATVAIYAGLSVATFLITLFIQEVGGYSAVQAGLALLPVTVIMFGLSPLFGRLAGTYGPRFFMSAGPLLAGSGFLSMIRVDRAANYWTELLPSILLFGLGLTITVAPLTSAILGAVNKQRAGIASAVNNAVARIAGLLAIAALGFVTGPQLTTDTFHKGIIFTGLLVGVGGIISALGIQNQAHPTDGSDH